MPTGRNTMLVALFFSALPLLAALAAVQTFTASKPNTTQTTSEKPVTEICVKASKPGLAALEKFVAGENAGDSLEEMRKPRKTVQSRRGEPVEEEDGYLDPMPRNFMPGGVMFVDTVAFTGEGLRGTFNAEAVVNSNGVIEINGWAIDTVQKNAGANVQLVFAGKDRIKVIDTEREERIDIVNVYNGEGYRYAGFTSQTNVNQFEPGDYRIFVRVVCMENAGCQQHDTGRKLSIVKPAKKEEEF